MTTTSRSVASERAGIDGAPSSRGLGATRVVAGERMLTPLALGATLLLLLNDHLLKAAWPGIVTGKLSDFAGLALFPLLLQAVWELAERARHGRFVRSRSVFLWAALATAVAFSLVKTLPLCAEAYRWGLGALHWLAFALVDSVQGIPVRGFGRVALARDVTDLVALPAVLLGLPAARQAQSAHEA